MMRWRTTGSVTVDNISEKDIQMARVSTYLNFMGSTEQAFDFYRSVFGGEFTSFQRMSEVPQPSLPEHEQKMIMHVELPTLGDQVLMGTDSLESMGHSLVFGNNASINLEPDTREETDRLFAGLSEGGKVTMPLMEMFWGGYFGGLTDRFGVQWMFNCTS
jgi:PhnB protein